jgi:hypothetical protein
MQETNRRKYKHNMKKCNQCEALIINGVFCHEHTCPNEHKEWINDEWVNVYECITCGCEVVEGETCTCCEDFTGKIDID